MIHQYEALIRAEFERQAEFGMIPSAQDFAIALVGVLYHIQRGDDMTKSIKLTCGCKMRSDKFQPGDVIRCFRCKQMVTVKEVTP